MDFTGVETSAAAAKASFGANGSNTWNHLSVPAFATKTTSATFSNLKGSDGNATGVSFSLATVSGNAFYGASDTPLNSSGSNGLRNDYFSLLGNAKVSFTLTGLPANTTVDAYFYAPTFGGRGFDIVVGGTTYSVPSGGADGLLATFTADATGAINGFWQKSSGEADWSGFQIAYTAPVPEPAVWAMMLTGFGGLAGLAMTKRRRAGLPKGTLAS